MINAAIAYNYDAAGNVTKRIVAGQTQTLTWTRANELSTITVGSGQQTYLYDADGMRIRKHMKTGSTFNWHVYEFFPQYELRVEGSTTTATRYYFFGGQRIAQKAGTVALTYLHTDMLGSTVRTVTTTGGTTGGKRYTSYGADHSGALPTDKTYTGQEDDGTELLYYGARYYDPRTGQFMSPDTIIPNPSNLFDYNRYMYARGNPLKYNDPSGHCVATAPAGPAGIPLDALCWAAIGKAAAAAGAAAAAAPLAAAVVGGALLVGGGAYAIAVADPSIPTYMPTIPPAINDIQETFPLGNTVGIGSTGIPLGVTDPTGAGGGSALPAGAIPNILADPLGQGIDLSPYLWKGEVNQSFMRGDGYTEATSQLTGGMEGAINLFEQMGGSAPVGGSYDPQSTRPIASFHDLNANVEAYLRPASSSGVPVVEIKDHGAKTYERIHFNK